MAGPIRAWFGNLRLQVKFFWILLAALLVVASGTLALSFLPYQAYNEQLYTRSVQMLTLFAQEVRTDLDNVAEVSYYMIGDSVLQESLSQMHKSASGSEAWVLARREVEDRLVYFSFLNSDVQSIRLRALDGTLFNRTPRGESVPLSLFYAYEERATQAKGRPLWVPDPQGAGTLILLRDVREIENLTLNSIGMIGIRLDLARIVERKSKSLRAMEMPLTTAIYAGDTLLFASDEAIAALNMPEDGYVIQDMGEVSMFCVRFTESGNGWTYVTAVPYESIMESIHQARSVTVALVLGVLTLTLLLCSLLVASILRHLKLLLSKYDAFARNELSPSQDQSPYAARRDEIGILHRQFDQMAADYARMIEENYVKQQLLLEAQVRQLRAQIQPHFLYNTLESIYCLAEGLEDQRIATMTDALGKMLRGTLRDKRDIITIEEDMQIARDYLKIQMIRLGDRLQVHFDVEDKYLRKQIPAMTLQPLVENAVRHAAEEMLEPCEIRVFCRDTALGPVELVVADNGPGMEEETLEKLESGEIQPEGLGIGLRNIHRRLGLTFSEAFGLRIHREQGWTNVIVALPGEEDPHDQAADC